MVPHGVMDPIVEIIAVVIHGRGIGRGGLCVRRVLWMEGCVGVGELTTHAERLISSLSELDVGVGYSYPSLYQKFMAKGRSSCTIPWREDVFLFAEVL